MEQSTVIAIVGVIFGGGIYAGLLKILWDDVSSIKNNHLPHIQEKLNSVSEDVSEIKGMLKK